MELAGRREASKAIALPFSRAPRLHLTATGDEEEKTDTVLHTADAYRDENTVHIAHVRSSSCSCHSTHLLLLIPGANRPAPLPS